MVKTSPKVGFQLYTTHRHRQPPLIYNSVRTIFWFWCSSNVASCKGHLDQLIIWHFRWGNSTVFSFSVLIDATLCIHLKNKEIFLSQIENTFCILIQFSLAPIFPASLSVHLVIITCQTNPIKSLSQQDKSSPASPPLLQSCLVSAQQRRKEWSTHWTDTLVAFVDLNMILRRRCGGWKIFEGIMPLPRPGLLCAAVLTRLPVV